MNAIMERSTPINLATRQWGAKLCLAADPTDASAVLAQAYLDLGFEAIDVVQLNGTGGVTIHWGSLGTDRMSGDEDYSAAKHDLLQRVDERVHRWVARQDRVLTQTDFLAQDTPAFTEFLHLPSAFGLSPWKTKVAIPFVADGRGLSIGTASMASFELQQSSLDQIQFLAQLYCALRNDPGPRLDEACQEVVRLNPKQFDCLRWAAAGKGYEDIGDIMGISERTVRYHLDNARERYGFATITQTIVQAAKDHDFDPVDARS